MIKYLGSKRLILPKLVELVGALEGVEAIADLFAGTSRVGHAFKREGYRVVANDHNAYAETLARCYVEADLEQHGERAAELLERFAGLAPTPGYFCRTFCEESRFFQPANGARVDAVRDEIARLAAAGELSDELEAVLLVALMEAADRVDSTTGLQMAYLKSWAKRAERELELRLPALLPRAAAGKGRALGLEAAEAAAALADDVDLCYLDPPYNQHKYLGNYHIWETLVRWDAPEAYGVARKRTDCRERRSAFNSKTGSLEALGAVIEAALSGSRVRYLLVSFNDEGFLDRAAIEGLLAPHGRLRTEEFEYKRYVGAQIGIHDPRGKRVGTVGRLRNKELLYLLERS